jgi:hypothetical protein
VYTLYIPWKRTSFRISARHECAKVLTELLNTTEKQQEVIQLYIKRKSENLLLQFNDLVLTKRTLQHIPYWYRVTQNEIVTQILSLRNRLSDMGKILLLQPNRGLSLKGAKHCQLN